MDVVIVSSILLVWLIEKYVKVVFFEEKVPEFQRFRRWGLLDKGK